MSESKNDIVSNLLEAGIHFGQRRSSWNPKMKPYIWGVRNGLHIIDIRETVKGLLRAKKFIQDTVASGKDVVFVGTKRQAQSAIQKYASEAGMPWVTERWLGGTLTNFATIRSRLKRLNELEDLVESGAIDSYSKKMTSQLMREKAKITRNLDGIRNMSKLPGCMVVIDANNETNALREAKALRIPTIGLVDTDGDPQLVDVPIPGNDDSLRSIEVVIADLMEAVNAGLQGRRAKEVAAEKKDEDEARATADLEEKRQRSTRATFKADESAPTPETTGSAATAIAQEDNESANDADKS
ncbi:MAG TPA: 30S ribosomal protein S2 [Phycisphaerales bacterium]|jgi:small subunit ribosomal protein S2|nr:30S ribosomal protein S2 [Phycisphaerales bacterium]HIB01282.1 30S ribosomal protein S2 [Phycisphaerales bacterium]HIO52012.1 30S ribosomal protein S2 [Phycisphaerales bacterium]